MGSHANFNYPGKTESELPFRLKFFDEKANATIKYAKKITIFKKRYTGIPDEKFISSKTVFSEVNLYPQKKKYFNSLNC